MEIKRIQIRNFRSFQNFDLDVEGRSLFIIGENGGGKTTLLTAVARAFGRDLVFRAQDFADLQQPIEIEIELTKLDGAQAAAFGNCADFTTLPPTLRIAVRAIWDDAAEDADVEHHSRVSWVHGRRESKGRPSPGSGYLQRAIAIGCSTSVSHAT